MLSADSSVHGWRKSSFSEAGNCVEVGADEAAIAVRDTKNRDRSELSFSFMAWGDFVRKIKATSSMR
jgi:hypothetical protein